MNNKKKTLIRQLLDSVQLSSNSQLPAHKDPHRRRFLKPYQARLKYVRDFWLYYLLFVLIAPITAPYIAASLLFNTFLSLAFLEETQL
ncbi:MAG: hypothetical protein OXE99_15160 [Cellvibrionales bacterium]|nr:hypothetical protein [Cellvibrionales bacterium]